MQSPTQTAGKKNRYRAGDYKHSPLPEDINDKVVNIVAGFDFPPLIDEIHRLRERKLHGRLKLLDDADVEIANIVIRGGIASEWDLRREHTGDGIYHPRRPYRLLWLQHGRNDDVTWRKD